MTNASRSLARTPWRARQAAALGGEKGKDLEKGQRSSLATARLTRAHVEIIYLDIK
jgi:hypothetical protein